MLTEILKPLMMEPSFWALIVPVGILAGVINTLVGGGTLLVLPMLIEVVGIDPHTANGTNRLCVAFQAAVAVWAFSRKPEKGSQAGIGFRNVSHSGLPTLIIGLFALPGAWLAGILDPEIFRKSLGILVLFAVGFFMLSGSRNEAKTGQEFKTGDSPTPLGVPMILGCVACGLYGGFIGAGIGAFIILMFTRSGIPLETAVRWKVTTVLFLSAVAGIYYAYEGYFSLSLAFPLLVAYSIGGYLGGLWIVKGGEKWLRPAVGVISTSLALMMLFRD
ncbi:MAG: TSUP family transporter [Planctomycetia bacterium]|jgi:hypothetical protein|nr:TSUP family transporter [Planctomycetia bacterium]